MNFEFSEESLMLRDQARNFLGDRCSPKVVRQVLEGNQPYAESLWREMAEMGWMAAAIPEEFGGPGLGYEALCVIAQELGRVLAPVPFSSSIYLASEAILAAGSNEQRHALIPSLADGSKIGTVALAEGIGETNADTIATVAHNSVLNGAKWPVQDGLIADFAIVVARDEQGIGLYLVHLKGDKVDSSSISTFGPSHGQSKFVFNQTEAERLGRVGDHWPILQSVIDRAAILTAFEQIGGVEVCLDMARDYAKGRTVFGRPLASFQAIKHKLADIFVELEIARSNAYYGAWALSQETSDLPRAAAAARVSAIEAYRIASKENIQTHGGVGFTWEFDCHLYYRHAKTLALRLGGARFWMNRLVDHLEAPASAEEHMNGF